MASRSAIVALPAAPRILVRGVNWLGDAVMTTPALLRLREKYPAAHITILTPEKLAELWKNHPAVNQVIPFSAGEGVWQVSRKLRYGRGPEILRGSEEKFHAGPVKMPPHYDLALVLPNSPRSALEVFLAGIPQRIGYARSWRNLFLTQTVAPRAESVKMHKRSVAEIQQLVAADVNRRTQTVASRVAAVKMHKRSAAEIQQLVAADVNRRTDRALPSAVSLAHQIHEYLHLAAALGANPAPLAPQLAVAPDEIEAVRKKFGLAAFSGSIFGLNPGAEYGPAKRWPAEKFIAAAKAIQQQTGCIWLIFGGKGDLALAGRIEAEIRHPPFAIRNCCGQTSLRELMALLKLCRVLLTNDTGPMHVAAALGTPVVVPFGSTSPELTGPGLPGDPRHRLLKSEAPCSPCFLRECPIDFRCLNGLSVDQIVEAVLSAIK